MSARACFAMLACLLALAWCVASPAHASLEASVDSTTISEADTLRFTLRADAANLTDDPDFAPLAESFDVVSSQRSSQFRSINGQIDAWTTWTLLLKPKRTGTLSIPALSLGKDRSAPIDVTVRELDPDLKRAISKTVFFETTYEPKQVYVQSQIVVTRRLYYVSGAQLYGDMPSVPEIPGAMVKSLGESDHSSAERDGRTYGVIEQRFAVFPERSGELTIPTASVTGSVRLLDESIGGGRRIGVDVTSDPLTIRVLPIPSEYPHDAPWLPAADVEVLEDWPYDAARGLATGTPTQRTLIVRAEGNTASAIPPLAQNLPDSIKVYPEAPSLSESATRNGIVGTRTESSSLVATQPGDLTLPPVSVTWWDTVHRQVKVASLLSKTVRVTGAPTETPKSARESPPTDAVPDANTTPAAEPAAQAATPTRFELWLAAALVAALLGWTVTVWRIGRRPDAARDTPPNKRDAERLAYVQLTRACQGGSAAQIRAALDAWLKIRYDAPLDDATRRFTADPAAKDALRALNARLYRREGSGEFDGAALRACVDAARRDASARKSAELPALYPSA